LRNGAVNGEPNPNTPEIDLERKKAKMERTTGQGIAEHDRKEA
jgi:hypothetical protein